MSYDATEQVEKFQEFIETNYKKDLHKLIQEGKEALLVDFLELSKFDPTLSEQLLEDSEDFIKAAEIALNQFDLGKELKPRFFNLPATQRILIGDIRNEHIDKFIFFEGIVRQASNVRPLTVSAKFECPACGNTINTIQQDLKLREPARCSCGRKGQFRLLSKERVDVQRLVVETDTEDLEGGAQPERLAVLLRDDLVEKKMKRKTTPGNKIRAFGIIKETPIPSPSGGVLNLHDFRMEANFIEPVFEEYSEIEISEEDELMIKELAKDKKIYEKFRKSIAPYIMGHDEIKDALVLQLMGGVRKEREDKSALRGDIHILLVGDPGAGKSALLTFISKAAPKARFASGKGSSAAGITASVVKDEFLKGWALEAGAIVLAHGGILVVDEMDKMNVEDTDALHEGLEQQQISINKANIHATLRCHTSVLAAANPKFGRFDPYTPIAQQIDLPPPLINRFDLIFTIKDIPDKVRDSEIAEHILESHSNQKSMEPEIPTEVLKKYIGYARQRIKPKLKREAKDVIKNFYVSVKNTDQDGGDGIKPIPISPRQLEALIRMSEASARVRLSKKVTKSDAERAISLLKECLGQVGIDPETGQLDIDRISTGIPSSMRSKILIVREIIKNFDTEGRKTISMEDIIQEAEKQEVAPAKVIEAIEMLKKEGMIFEPKRGHVQKI